VISICFCELNVRQNIGGGFDCAVIRGDDELAAGVSNHYKEIKAVSGEKPL
jgi:hypothetical protein